MWNYEKKLQYPVKITNPNPSIAKIVITQLGGPDGELSASMRYLNQRYAMPYKEGKAILTDVGTEELAHMEIIAAIVHQLTRNLTPEQIKESGFDTYFVDHTVGVYPQFAAGTPWSAMTFQSKGDPITDLFEDLAAEQKARTTYDNLLRLIDDPDIRDPLKYLREREVVHFQRFGDALRVVQENLDAKNYYAFNPAMDIRPPEGNHSWRPQSPQWNHPSIPESPETPCPPMRPQPRISQMSETERMEQMDQIEHDNMYPMNDLDSTEEMQTPPHMGH